MRRKLLLVSLALILAAALLFWLGLRSARVRQAVERLAWRAGIGGPEEPGDRRFGPAARPDPAGAPNVLVIAFDTVRADRMSCYGGPRPTTPVLDALARRGTRFAHCLAQAPYTPHSFCSMLSSLYVADLEVRVRGRPTKGGEIRRAGLEPYNVTLAEAMAGAGYATAAVVQGWFTEAFGLTQGFEWVSYQKRRLPAVVDATLAWIRAHVQAGADRPFFMFSYSLDCHYKFMKGRGPKQHLFGGDPAGFNFEGDVLRSFREGEIAPGEDDIRNALALYDEGLYWADNDLRKLLEGLEQLGIAHETLVVFVSDHGEEFNEHGFLSHGQSNFASVSDVPLIIVDPRRRGGRVVDTWVMNLDVMPTILDLCGVPVPETARGISLAPSLRGEEQPELAGRLLYAEGAWNGFVGAVLAGSTKYLLGLEGRPYLFDIAQDPGEERNLAEAHPARAARMEELLFVHKRDGLAARTRMKRGARLTLDSIGLPEAATLGTGSAPAAAEAGDSRPVLSRESEKQLKALGYL